MVKKSEHQLSPVMTNVLPILVQWWGWVPQSASANQPRVSPKAVSTMSRSGSGLQNMLRYVLGMRLGIVNCDFLSVRDDVAMGYFQKQSRPNSQVDSLKLAETLSMLSLSPSLLGVSLTSSSVYRVEHQNHRSNTHLYLMT